MHRILCEKARENFAEAIVSLDRALLVGAATLPRTDLIFVAGNRAARRVPGTASLPVSAPPAEYTAGRPLQAVELVVEGGVDLTERIYQSLWNDRSRPRSTTSGRRWRWTPGSITPPSPTPHPSQP